MRLATSAVTVAFVLTAAMTACSSSAASHSPSTASARGAVTGTLRLVGGPPPGKNESAAGTVYAFTSAGLTGRPVVTVKTGSNGSFRLTLPPGTYYLAATSPSFSIDPPPAKPPCRGSGPAVVSKGSTNRVDVACQMK